MIKSTKICAGFYKVSDGFRTVEVSLNDFCDGPGWIASAVWDQWRNTDPLPTKKMAMESAKNMLEDPEI